MKYAVIVIGLLLLSGVVSADYWQTSHILDSAGCGYYLDAVPDSLGNVHMFNFNNEEDTYNYILKNSSGYYSQTLLSDLPGYNKYIGSAVCDSNNEIHLGVMSEISGTSYTFYYMKRYINGSWSSPEEIFSAGSAGYTSAYSPISIAVDDDDNPWLICGYAPYSGGWYRNVTVWHKDEGWDMDVILPTEAGLETSRLDIEFNSANVPHIIYHPMTYGVESPFYFAYRTGDNVWVNSTITTTFADVYQPHESGIYFIDDTPHVLFPVGAVPRHAVLDGTWSVTQNVAPAYVYLSHTHRTSDDTLYMAGFDQDNGDHVYLSSKTPTGSWSSWEEITTLGGYSGAAFINPTTDQPNLFFASSSESSLYLAELIHTTTGCINVSGNVTYVNGTSVGSGETVAVYQNGEWYNTTTNATGGYTALMLEEDVEFTIFPVKSGYTSTPASYTLYDCGNYTLNLFLTEEDYESTAIGGIVYLKPYYEVESGLNVSITNGTFTDYNLTTDTGFYIFYNLTDDEEYTLTTSAPKHTGQSLNVTKIAGNFTQQDFILNESFTLSVQCRDTFSLNLISGNTVTVSLSTGQSNTTTTGLVNFTGLSYNVYNIIATCDDYYAGSSTIILDDDMSVVVYLEPMSDLSGPALNYVPHPVRFTYVDATGNPITGATVTAIAQESSNPWSWLSSVFGFNANLTDINTTLTGTTGHDGTLSFLMVETVQYRVNCVKTISGINHTVDIYPKESEYFIRIGSLPLVGSYPTYSLNATTVGGNVVLFGNYTDTSGSSSGVRFIVRNSTSEVYNTSVTLTGGVGSASYAVNNTKGTQLTFGITSEHTTQGHIEKWIDITLKGAGRLVDFGSGWTDFMYLAMSIAAIFLVAGCFGEIDTRLGAIFIPITAGMFWTIGWMGEVYGPLITIAGVLGALYYMRSKAKELDT